MDNLAQEPNAIWPADRREVTLRLDAEKQQVKAGCDAEFYQFRGRDYARMIFKKAKDGQEIQFDLNLLNGLSRENQARRMDVALWTT